MEIVEELDVSFVMELIHLRVTVVRIVMVIMEVLLE